MMAAMFHPLQRFVHEKWFMGLGIFVALVSVLTGVSTYILLTERPVIDGDSNNTLLEWLLLLDVLLLVTLLVTIGWRVWRIWQKRQQKLAGAQLHVQLTIAFSTLATIPAILVAIFAITFVNMSVQAWFGLQIRTAVTESQTIAQSYLQEHQQSIRADMLAMATDLNREASKLMTNQPFREDYFAKQAYLRNLSEALLLDGSGTVIVRAGISLSSQLMGDEFNQMITKARDGDVILSIGENEDRVRAMVKLDNFVDTYLFVGRFVDEKVISSVNRTNKAADTYQALQLQQKKLKRTMTMIFVLVALMLLLVAIWAGLALSERIIDPISRLIAATERVRSGDLNARVEEGQTDNEINLMAKAFNRMTDQLSTQRRELMNANRQIDERRRFTETVLSGVNAGVIAMDDKGLIQMANASALTLLHRDMTSDLVGKKLLEVCPEMETIRRMLRSKGGGVVEIPIDVDSVNAATQYHWVVRMTAEDEEGEVRRYVATFDDLSPLIDAQRKAAWSDVARRVAHEIKNPLTPIQLAAERLRKRYGKQITEDVETFNTCTDTIIRHVDDIRRMVDEFSAFARMPNATKQNENLVTVCQQAIVLFQQAHRQVKFIFDRPEASIIATIDRQQISQALTNVLKNAFEAVDGQDNAEVRLSIQQNETDIRLVIADNGAGWPPELLPRLTDPYVTTKATGTGLGLAIVAKIIEDHQGRIEFLQNSPQGAIIQLILPIGEIKHG
jgi:two-component system nitrogen regulation sensor histidine kinase NtrY